MKQIKIVDEFERVEASMDFLRDHVELHDDGFDELKNEINELRKELRMHISNCPFRSIY